MFINANLELRIGIHNLKFSNRSVSIYGASGLSWYPLSPTEHFGKIGTVIITLNRPEKSQLAVQCQIQRETTVHATFMNLKFHLTPHQDADLRLFVKKYGRESTEQIRKYTRIPSSKLITTFPLHAMVDRPKHDTLIFTVENISPNGILISTLNPQAMDIIPGDLLQITLEPRGWFPVPVRMEGMVCRLFDDLDPESGRISHRVGVKFTRITKPDKEAFIMLLKDILGQLKAEFK